MTETVTLSAAQMGTLEMIRDSRGELMKDSMYFDRESRRAARFLVATGFLCERRYANGTAYCMTKEGDDYLESLKTEEAPVKPRPVSVAAVQPALPRILITVTDGIAEVEGVDGSFEVTVIHRTRDAVNPMTMEEIAEVFAPKIMSGGTSSFDRTLANEITSYTETHGLGPGLQPT